MTESVIGAFCLKLRCFIRMDKFKPACLPGSFTFQVRDLSKVQIPLILKVFAHNTRTNEAEAAKFVPPIALSLVS